MTPFEEKLAELRVRFIERAASERALIAASLAAGDNTTVVDRVHKMAGLAGMIGEPAVGDAALAFEQALLAGRDGTAEHRELDALLATLG